MTSSASSASWLPAAIARAAVVTPAPSQHVPTGRHLAPDVRGTVRIAAPEDLARTGRHAEQEWSRETFDPMRDEVDAFDWLGFTATQR
jgi:hypothetical protein